MSSGEPGSSLSLPLAQAELTQRLEQTGIKPYYVSPAGGFVLLQGDCRALLPRLKAAAALPNLIFADPPYHLSNNGFTCQSGKRASVNKGNWDRSAGIEKDHEFVVSWLSCCLSSLAPGGSFWISGTHHGIFSVGYGLQELGAKILNVIVWEKTAPPPNLACRYYTHSHELVIWAKRSEKERHTFHYAFEKAANGGRQQKDIWYPRSLSARDEEMLPNHWRIAAPRQVEKRLGRHPTQKPLELLDRIIGCSSRPGDLILDPFCGSGTTGLAALGNQRRFVGIDLDPAHLELAKRRALEFINSQQRPCVLPF